MSLYDSLPGTLISSSPAAGGVIQDIKKSLIFKSLSQGSPGNPPLQSCNETSEPSAQGQERSYNEVSRGVGMYSHLDSLERNHVDEPSPVISFGDIRNISRFAVAIGGFSDIYLGQWEGTQVGLKMLRTFRRQDNRGFERRLNREIAIWRRMRHPNIAVFCGVSYEPNGRAGLIMEWYRNGTTPAHIARQKGKVDIRGMVTDIACGLHYLHSLHPPIVHGDLKGYNTLVTDSERVVISDFGLSRVIQVNGSSGYTTSTIAGSLRFQAPELLLGDEGSFDQSSVPRLSSDVYSFASTIYQLVTGRVPYQHLLVNWHVIRAVTEGVLPLEADDTLVYDSDGLEDLLKTCWSYKPEERPSMGTVIQLLKDVQFVSLTRRFV